MIFLSQPVATGELFSFDFLHPDDTLVGKLQEIYFNPDLSIKLLLFFDYQTDLTFSSRRDSFLILQFGDITSIDPEQKSSRIKVAKPKLQSCNKAKIREDHPEGIFRAELLGFNIIDKHGKKLGSIVEDLVLNASGGFYILLDDGLVIPDKFIRLITHNIVLNVPTEVLVPKDLIETTSLASLSQKLRSLTPNKPDWDLVEELINLGHFKQIQAVLRGWKESRSLSSDIHNLRADFYLGKVEEIQGLYTEALLYFLATKEALIVLGDDVAPFLAEVLVHVTSCFIHLSKMAEAEHWIAKTLVLTKKLDPASPLHAIALNWLGITRWLQGDPGRAFELFKEALSVVDHSSHSYAKAFTYHNLGGVYRNQGKIEESLTFFDLGLTLLHHQHLPMVAYLLNGQALSYYEQGNLGKALETFYDTLSLRKELANEMEVATTVVHIAHIEAVIGRFSKESPVLKHFPKPPYEIQILHTYGHIIDGLVAKMNNEWDEATQKFKYAVTDTSLDYNIGVWVFELIYEMEIRTWMKEKESRSLISLERSFNRAITLCKHFGFLPFLCKTLLIRARFEIFEQHFEEAKRILYEVIDIATSAELSIHQQLAEDTLEACQHYITHQAEGNDKEKELFHRNNLKQIVLYSKYLHINNLF